MIEPARRVIRAAERPITFSGAGLSAESGVPTFRDAATAGLWTKVDPTRLASPEGFADDPELVIGWYAQRRRRLAGLAPNPAHHALAARPDIAHITQNVDDLLERAGAERVLHLHGTLLEDRCHGCSHREPISLADPPPLRSCPRCGAPMRPGVVWFGESLPTTAWSQAETAAAACDVMIVIGTRAEVYPAAGLIDVARDAGAAIVVVNAEACRASDRADHTLIGPAGTIVPALLA
ncbi:MAG: NAD-dependent deacylase [Phycisphaerales bacterium]|nr:NAD-dependent deacylase [Phycisphaerae bacterium]NNF43078.1 NAD-dependent deacylase [Phycisphaerales bacterium]NNM24635.1 NAD-dependent deacylase [Phycisphaerales bacterium]